MSWLPQFGRGSTSAEEVEEEAAPPPVTGATPGVAELFESAGPGDHSILDLGPLSSASFDLYARYARRVRFADLFATWTGEGWDAAVKSLPLDPPCDIILGWDILDRIPPEGRRGLIDRLAALGTPNARLHLVVRSSREAATHPLRFTLLEPNRMRYEAAGPSQPGRPPLLPGEVERLIEPFRVERAFTLKGGLREYVARRAGGA